MLLCFGFLVQKNVKKTHHTAFFDEFFFCEMDFKKMDLLFCKAERQSWVMVNDDAKHYRGDGLQSNRFHCERWLVHALNQ